MRILLTCLFVLFSLLISAQNQIFPYMLKWAQQGSMIVADNNTVPRWNTNILFLNDSLLLVDGDTVATRNWVNNADIDNQKIDRFLLIGKELQISLENDNEPYKTVDLSLLAGSGNSVGGGTVTPNCPTNNNPLLPNVLRVVIGEIELASGDGNPTGNYQASVGSWFFDENGYAYRKFGNTINDWVCVLDGNSTFTGGGGGSASTNGLQVTDIDATGDSTLLVSSMPSTDSIVAVDVNGQGYRSGKNWTAINNQISWIDQGTRFPILGTWIRVWYRKKD